MGRFAHRAFLLPPHFDYFATLLWAESGALEGARRGYALLGDRDGRDRVVGRRRAFARRTLSPTRPPVMFNPGTFEVASALIGCDEFIALIKFTAVD